MEVHYIPVANGGKMYGASFVDVWPPPGVTTWVYRASGSVFQASRATVFLGLWEVFFTVTIIDVSEFL